MTAMTATAAPSRGANILRWTLQVPLAAAFFAAGLAKATGQPAMVALFDGIGFGQWFRFVTAAVEIGSAVLLMIPRRAVLGALLAVPTMVGAILTHLLLVGGSPVPALVLLTLSASILFLRRGEFAAIRSSFQ